MAQNLRLTSVQDQLLASEARYRRLFNENPIPMWVYDPMTLRFLDVNDSAVDHYGYTREEFLSMSVLDIRPAEDIPALLASLTKEDGRDFSRHRTKDGSIIDVEILSHPIGSEEMGARVVTVIDVTQRRRTEQELRHAFEAERAAASRLRDLDEMKNTFLTAVSHELRTPLAAVLGSALTLQRLRLDLTELDQADLIQAVAVNARKLERMLADLLDLDRLTRGVVRAQRAAAELGSLVKGVVENSDIAGNRPIHVETHQMVFPVDGPKVERILENLLANAVKYTPEGTPVWISIKRIPEGALICVEDAGPGVPPEERTAVFQPFHQGPNRSEHAPGVGVGLSLVAKFAELHGGRAWVEERAGGGSSFRVVLREPTAPSDQERGV
jgi:PAS domain S-box-containing protein